MPHDNLRPLEGLADTLAGAAPAADRATPVIQWIFQRSPWFMWGTVLLAAACALFFLRWFWPRRVELLGRLRAQSVGIKVVFAVVVGIACLGMAGAGYKSYEFVETDKRFCNGCHIFVPSGQAWAHPDTGSYSLVPRLEGKHDTLSCHTCHPLKPMKEAVKLFFWMSGVRGDSIPEHARVPRAICEQCHVRGEASETWQEIAATAGHRTHFESDSLKHRIECLTCHARTAHHFVPVNETCGQSGCHSPDDFRIRLGKMSAQDQVSSFHCQACHNFIATVPKLATRDSAASTLRPALQQCFACHAMKQHLPDFNADRDPHKGTCGMCHNPHVQDKPIEAAKSCTSAKCHASWREEPFHIGERHREAAQQCITCHPPHAARVDASDCVGCHTRTHDARAGRRPPLPFDTLKALQESFLPAPLQPLKPLGDGPQPEELPDPLRPQKPQGDGPALDDVSARSGAPFVSAPADTFPHARHKKLACLTCHFAASGHGKLTFEPPRGCQICHHRAPSQSDCKQCHDADSLAAPIAVEVTVHVPKEKPRTREVGYPHTKHSEVECIRCHTTRVTMEPGDSVVTCEACHSDHHASGRACATCHKTDAIKKAHERPRFMHVACDECHTAETVGRLVPTRSFCQACHDQGRDQGEDHYESKECSGCHFLRSPDQFRRQLTRGGSW